MSWLRASVQLGNLDLLGARGLDPRTVPLVDPPANAHDAIFKPLEPQSGPREHALMAFQYRDRERFRPPPSEVQVDRAPALADRPDFALDDCELTPFGQEFRPLPGRHYHIIRFAPEAKLGRAGRTLS